jgi:uncharacterized repeat protein (TIGR03803 family)
MVLKVFAAAIAWILHVLPIQAQTYSVLYNFTGGSDGITPIAGLTMDPSGNLYGTASAGSTSGFGNVYQLQHSGVTWTFHLLWAFEGFNGIVNDGSAPWSRAVFGPGGSLYGTTHSGANGQGCNQLLGCGAVYSLSNSSGMWRDTLLRQFGVSSGANPDYGDVVFDLTGNMYGTTRNGGSGLNGLVYELIQGRVGWTETVLHNFSGTPDGATPLSGVIVDSAGNLYGTTSAGGASGNGTVYEISPSGVETVLYSFTNGSDGGGRRAA